MKNIKAEGEREVEIKRFHFPISFKIKCAHCGEEIEQDFEEDYLSYPTLNKEEEVGIYCDECGEDSYIKMTLHIDIDVDLENVRKG